MSTSGLSHLVLNLGYRGFESRGTLWVRRHAVEHERPSALSFKQVIAGSIPVNGTKVVGP
jgi:hypothetical protein